MYRSLKPNWLRYLVGLRKKPEEKLEGLYFYKFPRQNRLNLVGIYNQNTEKNLMKKLSSTKTQKNQVLLNRVSAGANLTDEKAEIVSGGAIVSPSVLNQANKIKQANE